MSKRGDIKYRRRKYPRRPLLALCDIFAPDRMRILGRGCIMNFSQGGLSVVMAAPIGRGRTVGINVSGLHQKRWLFARVANVRNVTDRTYSCGLEFEGLGSIQRNLVDFRLRRLARLRAA